MKNRNVTENPALSQTAVKCRFFAQYWGTKTMYVGGVGLVEIGTGGWNLKHPDFFLQLKPLSKITNEDAVKIAQIFGMTEDLEFIGIILCTTMFDNSEKESETVLYNSNAKAVDYLRSKGYALPFMEYSVEDLVELGWVRLV